MNASKSKMCKEKKSVTNRCSILKDHDSTIELEDKAVKQSAYSMQKK